MAERQKRADSHIPPPAPPPLPVSVVDNHTHLDHGGAGEFATDAEVQALLDQAAAVGVPRAIQVGCSLPAAHYTIGLLDRFPQLAGALALHPNTAARHGADGTLDQALATIADLAQHPRVVCIGETGLDYFRTDAHDCEAVAAQKDSFRAHIQLAKDLDLTLQIHDRDAHDDVLSILAQEGAPARTVLHCFSGDVAMARECVERGYFLSFAGTVTFKNADTLRAVAHFTPPGQALVETDAPYLTPMPYRGRPNASYLVPLTVRALAQVWNVDEKTACESLNLATERAYPNAW